MRSRVCSRTGCSAAAVATLTYVYADSTAVLGPLALQADPNGYDLCQRHEANLSVPRGWEVIRLPAAEDADAEPSSDDLLALANAVREVGFALDPPPVDVTAGGRVVELARRGHLTVLADPDA